MPNTQQTLERTVDLLVFPTELGWFGFTMEEEIVLAVTIGNSSESHAQTRLQKTLKTDRWKSLKTAQATGIAQQLVQDLQRFAAGETIDFQQYEVSLTHLTDFQCHVINAVREIPFGETLSYAEVASRAGSPLAARAVGNVMANNRTPIIIPCHRVLAAGGRWGGFTAPGGVDFKRRLLAQESPEKHV